MPSFGRKVANSMGVKGPVRPAPEPTTNVGLVNAITKQLNIKEGSKGWANKVAAHVGVHPDTVRRWKRGQRPTLNTALVTKYRAGEFNADRMAAVANSNGPTIEATIVVSDTAVKQNCHLGNHARNVMMPRHNMGQAMANAYLQGESPMREFRRVVDDYMKSFGGELVKIHSITW